ncbi:MAG: hypothetical protein KA175_10340 [Flavobacteriales bacterium]|nr:hypothetical protein [Flavobacteriales bacterium]MBP6698008.1 hypothetical protein [Flavobacteriales bacterium]
MRTKLLILLVSLRTIALCQDDARYNALVKDAYAHYEKKAYRASAERYSAAFEVLGWKGEARDRYNAACSWALAGVPDSAFFQLFRLAEKVNYTNLPHITTDTDLDTLHPDVRWERLIALVRANKEKAEVNLDRPLAALLDSIVNEDQHYRHRIDEVEQQHGRDSQEIKALWRTISEKDSSNVIVVSKILDERGWLGADIVGQRGNQALFLVVQHADITVQEKYLPMMRDAVKKGNATASSLALLEDRVALEQGRRQIYGSQIGRDKETDTFYVSPLEDPDHVDERRKEVGLEPIADYVSRWGFTWDAEAYKKELPLLEKKLAKEP